MSRYRRLSCLPWLYNWSLGLRRFDLSRRRRRRQERALDRLLGRRPLNRRLRRRSCCVSYIGSKGRQRRDGWFLRASRWNSLTLGLHRMTGRRNVIPLNSCARKHILLSLFSQITPAFFTIYIIHSVGIIAFFADFKINRLLFSSAISAKIYTFSYFRSTAMTNHFLTPFANY
jgi:hypothetical protein